MSRQEINLGTAPTGAGGDTTRSAAAKMNAMSTELYAALGGTNGTLPSALPIAKGGTGVTDGRAIFSEVGVQQAAGRYNIQGLYMGWNAAGLGEGHFIVNKGNGDGGFSWRTVNAGNTAGGPAMTYSNSGTLTVPTSIVTSSITTPYASAGILTITNEINTTVPARGYRCRTGVNGSYAGTAFNLSWTGSNVDVFIDATYVGTMTLFGSDYRFKKYIKDAPKTSYLDRINDYRIVTYQRKNFGDVFKGDDVIYQGLIAHEAQAVNPLAVTGEKDGVGEDGKARVQQLDPMALITDLMGAVKELRAELAALKAAQA
jgi:hypothetical protein